MGCRRCSSTRRSASPSTPTTGGFDTGEDPGIAPVVTVEFDLRYRRPAPTGVELVLRGEVLRTEGRDYWAAASICDIDGQVLTEATARWKRLAR